MAGTWWPFPQGIDDPVAFIDHLDKEEDRNKVRSGTHEISEIYWAGVGNILTPRNAKLRALPRLADSAEVLATDFSFVTLRLPSKRAELATFPTGSGSRLSHANPPANSEYETKRCVCRSTNFHLGPPVQDPTNMLSQKRELRDFSKQLLVRMLCWNLRDKEFHDWRHGSIGRLNCIMPEASIQGKYLRKTPDPR